MFKALSLFGITALSLVYAIGFIYDSTYIEYFGANLNQLFATPAEYLAIGGILLFRGAVKWFSILFFLSGFIACAIIPAKKELNKRKLKLSKYIDLQSAPIILSSILITALIIYPGIVINIALADAENDKKQFTSKNHVIKYQKGNIWNESKGILLRNRNGLTLLYDSKTGESLLIPTENILVITN